MKSRSSLPSAFWVTLLYLFFGQIAFAGSATWNLKPASSDWGTAKNWTPTTVPNGPDDTATFALSNVTDVAVLEDVEVSSIVFGPGASAFTFMMGGGSGISGARVLTISGAGIINNSGVTQNFVNLSPDYYSGSVFFTNTAAAGDGNIFTNEGNATFMARGATFIQFLDTSRAGTSTFINNGAETDLETNGTFIEFYDSSSADHGTFINKNAGYTGGRIEFYQDSTAGSATIINEGGAKAGNGYTYTEFLNASAGSSTITAEGSVRNALYAFIRFALGSNADDAMLIARNGRDGGHGGVIYFLGNSHGDRARVDVSGNGTLDISGHGHQGMTIGSLKGDGLVVLGANNLSIGASDLSTEFGGVISQAGSVTKIGRAKLSLTNANIYDGGTTVKEGKLLVNNTTGSGTGPGSVSVESGTLGGTGTIAGPVTVGTGAGPGAILVGGRPRIPFAPLTIQSGLLLNADATFYVRVNSNDGSGGAVVANGVSISGAQFSISDLGSSALSSGTTLTVVDNISTMSIAGTFGNLPDGTTVTAGANTFQADYEGGDGNDLTLTVVP